MVTVMKMSEWKKINASPQTNNTLKLLSALSGISITEIIRRFAQSMVPYLLENEAGCDVKFFRVQEGVTVKFVPKEVEKNE